MSNIFKYNIDLDTDSAIEERDNPLAPKTIPYLAFALVGTVMTTVFSAIVMILDYCFPTSLDGTYLKLFF